MAAVTKIEELQLDKPEADMLAGALVELERQYPTQIDPRVMAWINFVGVAGTIYGSRVFAWRMRMQNEKAERQTNEPRSLTLVPTQPFDGFSPSHN